MTTIEALTTDYFDLAAQWLSRPAINRWLTQEWRNKEITASIMAIAMRNRRNRLFLVRYQGEPCGLAGLADIEPADRVAMAWYVLGVEALSGRGITSAAVRQLTVIAFAELLLGSLYAWTMEDNTASQKVLRNAGFREAGRLRMAACSADRQVDRVYFDLIPDEAVRPCQ